MNKQDKVRIKAAVLSLLKSYGRQISLPLKIKKVTKSMDNVRLIPFSTHMERHGLSYQEMLLHAGTDDAYTDYDASSGRYVIVYNDLDEKKLFSDRYRWNIAHELGHVALGHHQRHPESRLFRNELSHIQYQQLEEEADMFAAYILVPHLVVLFATDGNNVNDIDLRSLCRISSKAAEYRLRSLKEWIRRWALEKYDMELLERYADYLEYKPLRKSAKKWLDDHRCCPNCGTAIGWGLYYCNVCGHRLSRKYELEENIMKYAGIEIDEQGRMLECPICHNTQLAAEGKYCMVCGNLIVNFCSEMLENGTRVCDNEEQLPCNARYCPFCGGKSTFFTIGALKSWNGKTAEELELPF